MKPITKQPSSPQPGTSGPNRRQQQPNGLPRQVRTAKQLLMVLIPLGILGNVVYVAYSTQGTLLTSLSNANVGPLLLAIVLLFVPSVLQATRIRLWARVFGRPVSFAAAYRSVMWNEIGAAATPTALGGGYAKAYYLSKAGMRPAQALFTMMAGSLEDCLFLFAVVPSALIFSSCWENQHILSAWHSVQQNLTTLAWVAVGSLALWGATRMWRRRHRASTAIARHDEPARSGLFGRTCERLRAFRIQLKRTFLVAFRRGRWTLMINALLSTIGWICRYGSINLIFFAFDIQTDPVLFFLLHWVVYTLTSFVVSPGGIGGAEVVFLSVFGGLAPAAMLPMTMAVWRFLTFFLLVIAAAIILITDGVTKPRPRWQPQPR